MTTVLIVTCRLNLQGRLLYFCRERLHQRLQASGHILYQCRKKNCHFDPADGGRVTLYSAFKLKYQISHAPASGVIVRNGNWIINIRNFNYSMEMFSSHKSFTLHHSPFTFHYSPFTLVLRIIQRLHFLRCQCYIVKTELIHSAVE